MRCSTRRCRAKQLYPFALDGEAVASGGHHGDNVGAMLLGGIVLATPDRLVRMPAPAAWHCVLVHPDATLETRRAREALKGAYALTEFVAPERESRAGAQRLPSRRRRPGSRRPARRAGRTAARAADSRVSPRVKQAALDHGALGASISGAGPERVRLVRIAWSPPNSRHRRCAPAFAEAGLASESFVSPVNGPAAELRRMKYHQHARRARRRSDLSAAIAAGLAPDGGLYVPRVAAAIRRRRISRDCDTLAAIAHASARAILRRRRARAASSPRSAPRRSLSPRRCARWRRRDDHVLELFHGPTAAFKDFGARFLAACMRRLPRDAIAAADDPRRDFRRHRRGGRAPRSPACPVFAS